MASERPNAAPGHRAATQGQRIKICMAQRTREMGSSTSSRTALSGGGAGKGSCAEPLAGAGSSSDTSSPSSCGSRSSHEGSSLQKGECGSGSGRRVTAGGGRWHGLPRRRALVTGITAAPDRLRRPPRWAPQSPRGRGGAAAAARPTPRLPRRGSRCAGGSACCGAAEPGRARKPSARPQRLGRCLGP